MLRLAPSALILAMLASCQKSPVDILQIDVIASIDGRVERSSSDWGVQVSDGFPEGAEVRIDGTALVIHVAKGITIYGLIRGLRNERVVSAAELIGQLDGIAAREAIRNNANPSFSTESYTSQHRFSVKELTGRRIPICQSSVTYGELGSYCIVFVYFEDMAKLSPVRVIPVGTAVTVGNHSVVISSATIGYSSKRRKITARAEDKSSVDHLISKANRSGQIAPLPLGTRLNDYHILTTDLRRQQ